MYKFSAQACLWSRCCPQRSSVLFRSVKTTDMAASKVVRLVIHWLRSVEPYLTTGRCALLRVRSIPQLRRLNKECFNENMDTDIVNARIRYLVAICLKDFRTPKFLNNVQGIGLEPKYVELVYFMLLWFKRQPLYANAGADLATAAYDLSGHVSWVSTGMVHYMYCKFQREVQVVKGAMQKYLAKHPNCHDLRRKLHREFELSGGPRCLTLGLRRSSSVPRVRDLRRRRQKRSKSSDP